MGMKFAGMIVGAMALASVSAPAFAITTFFDDFSTYGGETLGIKRPNDTVFFDNNWRLRSVGDSVDLFTSTGAIGQNVCPTAFCVDLDGTTNDAAAMETVQKFDPGSYEVTIGLFGRNPLGLDPVREATAPATGDSVKVAFGTGVDERTIFRDSSVSAQQDLSGTFFIRITKPLSLVISTTGNDNVGAILTLVSVTAVPLPAAAPLLAGALGLFGWLGYRRRRALA